MQLTTVSSYDEVRAILGVSNEELEDATLGLSIYDTEVDIKMDSLSAAASGVYDTVAAIAEGSRTADQQRFYKVYRLLCSYLFAETLFKSLPMFSYKQLTDGKAEVARFESFETVERGIKAGINTTRLRLSELLGLLGFATGTVARTQVFLVAATLAINPVTNS